MLSGLVPLSEAYGEQRAASHAEAQQDGCQKGHQCEGGSYSGQGVFTQELPYNQGIRHIIELLEKIPQNHGDREEQHRAHNRPAGQILVHFLASESDVCLCGLYNIPPFLSIANRRDRKIRLGPQGAWNYQDIKGA